MKRSEILRLMQSTIVINYGTVKFPMPVSDLCEKMLRAIEEVGMIPPTYTERLGCDCCSNTVEGEWEKE